MNFDLAAAIRDKKSYPDSMEITLGDGVSKLSFGEMRAFQEATGQDVARALEAERAKLAEEQAKVAAAQEEVVKIWTALEAAKNNQAPAPAAAPANDWTKDPLFSPIAEHIDKNVMAEVRKLADNYAQVQKALALGVKYITDNFSEMRYISLPEDFRKEIGYDAAVKTAAEKKFLDSGGVPDIRKVYDEWRIPRERKSYEEKVQKEAYEKARQDLLSNSLARPGGMAPAPAAPDPNAPKSIRESFQRLKEDPEFLNQIYSLTGQPN